MFTGACDEGIQTLKPYNKVVFHLNSFVMTRGESCHTDISRTAVYLLLSLSTYRGTTIFSSLGLHKHYHGNIIVTDILNMKSGSIFVLYNTADGSLLFILKSAAKKYKTVDLVLRELEKEVQVVKVEMSFERDLPPSPCKSHPLEYQIESSAHGKPSDRACRGSG